MQNNTEYIQYKNEKIKFYEEIYYNGSKLYTNEKHNLVLAWNNSFNNYEKWFLIKMSSEIFYHLLAEDISL